LKLKVRDSKLIFFTVKKNFYLNPSLSHQNNNNIYFAKGQDTRRAKTHLSWQPYQLINKKEHKKAKKKRK